MGGGFYMDCAARDDARSARRADALDVAVIGVDYRLAPESPWPAAPDDCEAVARWLIEVAQSRFGTRRLTIGGVSAGATLVVATLVRLRSRGLATRFAGEVLEAGSYDLSGQTPAGRVIEGNISSKPMPAMPPIAAIPTSHQRSPIWSVCRRPWWSSAPTT